MQPALPLPLGPIDHYTLIVEDAAAVSRFHTDVLGFEPLRIQKVNAGSAPEGEHDMLNHVLQIPSSPGRVLVVTEGLRPDSIFSQYLEKYGPGVHHVAYEVPDIEAAAAILRSAGYRLTSDRVLQDPLTGLRQIFISREHGGYFIELLERTPLATGGAFTPHNMAALARTMQGYLADEDEAAPEPLVIDVAATAEAALAVLADPLELPRWTAHRGVRRVDGALVEVRMYGDVPLAVTRYDDDSGRGRVEFVWTAGDARFAVTFYVAPRDGGARIEVGLPPLPPERAARAATVIAAELRLLRARLDGTAPDEADVELVDAFHLDVHQRRGL